MGSVACTLYSVHCTLCILCIIVHRGAEAGGILGVNTPHFLGCLKNGSWRVGDNKELGAGREGEKFRGGNKKFGWVG